MEFYIKKNATLPLLKMQVVKDGRSDYNRFMQLLEESSIFFSMVDIETGIPKIQNKPAGLVNKTFLDPNADPEYYIFYQFSNLETKKPGRYEGQFIIVNYEGTLILPIRDKLFINIQESFICDDLSYDNNCYVVEYPCCNTKPVGPVTTTTTTICYVPPITTTTTTIPPPTTTTTTTLSPFSATIVTLVIPGSVKVQSYVQYNYGLDVTTCVSFDVNLETSNGDVLVVPKQILLNSGETTGYTETILDYSYSGLSDQTYYSNIDFSGSTVPVEYNTEIITQITPTPTPSASVFPTLYYGKLTSSEFDPGDETLLQTIQSVDSVNIYLDVNAGTGYVFVLIPQSMNQPIQFRNSVSGCNGFVVPIINKPDVTIIDIFGNIHIYKVYRTWVSTNAQVDLWLCG
jgi:hypothetical protein